MQGYSDDFFRGLILRDLTFNGRSSLAESRNLRWIQLAAGALILAGFAIDFSSIRWGAYIPTPIPGVFLADALWAAGALLVIPTFPFVHFHKRVLYASTFAAVLAAVQWIRGSLLDGGDPYLALRDVAPFLYLALVPLVASALSAVKWRIFLGVLRVGSIVLAIGTVVVLLNVDFYPLKDVVTFPYQTGIIFPGRGDLLGVSLGVGVIAWGNFGALGRPSRVIQGALIAVGFSNGSRAGLLALLVCIGWAIFRERAAVRWITVFKIAGSLATCILASYLLTDVLAQHPVTQAPVTQAPVAQAPVAQAPVAQAPVAQAPTTSNIAERMAAEGLWNPTASARWQTYGDVLSALTKDWSWIAGAGVGDPFRLLEACGVTALQFERTLGVEKCAVDSGSNPVPLRDPHNWVLALLLYHGLVGTLTFVTIIGTYLWPPIREPDLSLAAVPVSVYLLVGMVSVVISSPFGMLPIATFVSVVVIGATHRRSASATSAALRGDS